MQTAHLANHLITGTQVQMIGIGEFHLAADILKILGTQASLDGCLSSHIHKNGGLNRAVGAGELTAASLPFGFL